MSEALQRALGEIAERRPVLDGLDDLLSGLIAEVETALRRHVSIRIEVDVGGGQILAFGKTNSTWRLLWGSRDDEEPLASAPRDVRADVFALGRIEQLVIASVAQLDRNIEARQSALAEARRLVAALGSERP